VRLILVLSYSYLRPIKTDEERQSNWTKVSVSILGSARECVFEAVRVGVAQDLAELDLDLVAITRQD